LVGCRGYNGVAVGIEELGAREVAVTLVDGALGEGEVAGGGRCLNWYKDII
ncbi:hypothetical protein KI387_017818, partial [Taxus chinensis]